MPPEVSIPSPTLAFATSPSNSENSGTADPTVKKPTESDATRKKSDDAPVPMSPRLRGPSQGSSPLLPPAPGMPLPCLSPTLRGIAAGGISLVAGRRNISTPQFRVLYTGNADTTPKKMAGKHYVAAQNLSLVESLDVVEYDMDREDEQWLSKENAFMEPGIGKPLSEDVFEIVINCLEKQAVLLKQTEQSPSALPPITCQLARSVLIPMLKRLCGGTDQQAASVLDQWLTKVYAHWELRRQKIAPRTLLRWERPSTNLQQRAMAEPRVTLSQSPPEVTRRPSAPTQRRERTHGPPQWRPQPGVWEGMDKILPRCDIQMLQHGSKSLMGDQAAPPVLVPRHFVSSGGLQELPEMMEIPAVSRPLNPEANQALFRRFESERRGRREAEVKLKRLRQHTGEELHNLRRKMESKVEEQEQMLAAIELNLDRLQEEEAALRRRCDAEHKKYEVEHRKYEAERRTRQQRELDIEKERKKQSRERGALEKRLQDEMIRSSAVQEDARTALERGLLGDSVAKAVAGIASQAQRSLASGVEHLDKLAASRKPARALSTLVAQVQDEFGQWQRSRLQLYEDASAELASVSQQVSAPQQVPAAAPEAQPETVVAPNRMHFES